MLKLDVTDFLTKYWQKRPAVLRQAWSGSFPDVDGHDLAALALDPQCLARLVRFDTRRKQYRLEHGPFTESRFADLPSQNWTLLVQDVDKWLPEVGAPVLAAFSFLPRWRIEDIMISYAVPGGNVGPHVDQYDVFLIQATGHRRWSIDQRRHVDTTLDPDAPLKLLKHFQPTDHYDLAPGDVLYLPPGVPHHGVAIDTCTTWSLGLRAPSDAECLAAMAHALLEASSTSNRGHDGSRYRDPDLTPPDHWYELDAAALGRIRAALQRGLEQMDQRFLAEHAARFLCRYRAPRATEARRTLPLAAFQRKFAEGWQLARDPWHRLLWTREGRQTRLHCSDLSALVPVACAQRLCSDEGIDARLWARLNAESQASLRQMHAQGVLQWRRP